MTNRSAVDTWLFHSIYTYSNIPLDSLVSRHLWNEHNTSKLNNKLSAQKERQICFPTLKGYMKGAGPETGSGLLSLTLMETSPFLTPTLKVGYLPTLRDKLNLNQNFTNS